MIDRNSFDPLYVQVKNHITSAIESGEIKIGDKLMSENEMLKFYGVGRVTIRNALSELVAEGCLRKEQGLGTFSATLSAHEYLRGSCGFRERIFSMLFLHEIFSERYKEKYTEDSSEE